MDFPMFVVKVLFVFLACILYMARGTDDEGCFPYVLLFAAVML